MKFDFFKWLIIPGVAFILGMILSYSKCSKTTFEKVAVVKTDTIFKVDTLIRVKVIKGDKVIETNTEYVYETVDSIITKESKVVILDTVYVSKFQSDSISTKRNVLVECRNDIITNQVVIKPRGKFYIGAGVHYTIDEKFLPIASIAYKNKKDFVFEVGLFTAPVPTKKFYENGFFKVLVPLK